MTIALVSGLVMFVLLFIDLLTKALAEAYNVSQGFIPGFMSFNFYKNEGIAFGTWSNSPEIMNFVITPLTIIMIGVIAAVFFTVFKKNKPAQVCLAVIEAGAIGNLVDRLCLGYVRDFVDVSAFRPLAWLGSNFNFGICNIADFYISFGAVALFIILLFIGKDAIFPTGKWKKEHEKEKAEEAEEETHGT